MAEAVRSKKKASMDDKIELFCQTSAELIANIHARCDKTAEGAMQAKGKRGRRKKAKKEE